MTIKYKIESKIKIPRKKPGRKLGSTKYPFASMKIGQSFLVKNKALATMFSVSKNWAKTSGTKFKFTCRQLGKDVRVWRTQ